MCCARRSSATGPTLNDLPISHATKFELVRVFSGRLPIYRLLESATICRLLPVFANDPENSDVIGIDAGISTLR
jgi:hypothetical protein